MERDTKNAYFMKMLDLVCSRSTCLRRSVGAIIVDNVGHILSTGYNGVPMLTSHCTAEYPCAGATDPGGDTRRCMAVHAEANALLQCHRIDLAETMYVSVCPCFQCAKMILNTDITHVVIGADYPGDNEGKTLLINAERLWLYDAPTGGIRLFLKDGTISEFSWKA